MKTKERTFTEKDSEVRNQKSGREELGTEAKKC
jgi:hypothetical protein